MNAVKQDEFQNGTEALDGSMLGEALSLEELASLCENRANVYAMLATMFSGEPNREVLRRMHTWTFSVQTGSEHWDTGSEMLATYLSNTWENSSLELAVDYTRSFIGYGMDGESAAYPYESVYTNAHRLLMQNARDEVRLIYQSADVERDSGVRDEDDHIAVELSFMELLCRRTAEAARVSRESEADTLLKTQRNFLENHLVRWAPLFAQRTREFAESDFYQGAAYLLEGFMEVESELFSLECLEG